jgi:3-oxoacyl-[acyl-carrier protein] reductase
MDLGLAGKIALVSGGTRGLGWATVERLAAEGCAIGLCSRSAEAVQVRTTALQRMEVRAHGVVADVTQPGDVERFVEECAAALGGVDLLVANVGGSSGGALLETTREDWIRTFDLNLFHAVQSIRAAVPHMQRRGGGSVAIIASISGSKPAPRGQYGAAKASEIFLAGALAWELADHKIRVNAVSPGSIMFPGGGWERFEANNPDQFQAFAEREFPWGRLGRAEEVADVVAFVLSERANWINGANIPVDGAQGRPNAFLRATY